jgi:Na+-driven multidrug efflux pump
MTSGISLLLSAIVIIFGKYLMGIFTPDQNVIDIGYDYLIIVGSFYIIFSTLFVVNAVMRGAGDTLVPMFITLIALWGVRVPASYLLADRIGVTGIWWAVPIGWGVGMILTILYYYSGKWKKKVLVKPDKKVI